MTKLDNLFETLKDQFDLPPKAIAFQDQFRREILFRKGRYDHDELRIEQRFRLQFGARFAGSASEFFVGRGDSRFAFSNHAHTGWQWSIAFKWDQDSPLANLTGLFDSL